MNCSVLSSFSTVVGTEYSVFQDTRILAQLLNVADRTLTVHQGLAVAESDAPNDTPKSPCVYCHRGEQWKSKGTIDRQGSVAVVPILD